MQRVAAVLVQAQVPVHREQVSRLQRQVPALMQVPAQVPARVQRRLWGQWRHRSRQPQLQVSSWHHASTTRSYHSSR